jgi:hypothetical protein
LTRPAAISNFRSCDVALDRRSATTMRERSPGTPGSVLVRIERRQAMRIRMIVLALLCTTAVLGAEQLKWYYCPAASRTGAAGTYAIVTDYFPVDVENSSLSLLSGAIRAQFNDWLRAYSRDATGYDYLMFPGPIPQGPFQTEREARSARQRDLRQYADKGYKVIDVPRTLLPAFKYLR